MPPPTAAVVCVVLLSCFFLLLPPPTSSATSSAGSTASATSGEAALRVAGDVVLGGLFPMHEQNLSRREMPCGAIKEEKGIQRMEAMMYALDQINADGEVLRGVLLGAHILDTCSNPEYALEQSMRFVKLGDEQPCSSPTSSTFSKGGWNASGTASVTGLPPVTGVIGAAFSGVSIMVANILRLFKIPQISYASTSTELSDKTRFEYFSRVVPPDNFQAQAMIEIAKQMGWKYVSTVAAEGEYGEKGIASFVALAKTQGICIAVSTKIKRAAKQTEFDSIVDMLASKPKARAVVLFVDEDRTRKLLSATVRRGKTGYFYWIGSDSWGAKIHPVRHQEWAAEGAITILPKRSSLEGFDEYFTSLRPPLLLSHCQSQQPPQESPTGHSTRLNCRNPWFRQFWSHHFNCRFEDQRESEMPPDHRSKELLDLCTGRERLTKYEQEGLVPFVVDAVYAMAHALDNMVRDTCAEPLIGPLSRHQAETEAAAGRFFGSRWLCPALLPKPDGADLLAYVRNVSFVSIQGDAIGDVKFNKDGDRIGRYSIYQYQYVDEDSAFKYVLVGEFGDFPALKIENDKETGEPNKLKLEKSGVGQELAIDVLRMKWPNVSGDDPPKSVCSEPCPMGHVRSYADACCWSCSLCREDSVVVGEDECRQCPIGYSPSQTKDQCLLMDAYPLDWESLWAFIPIVCASIGICITLDVVAVFIIYNRSSIVKASGRELSYVLLCGILASYTCTFIILAEPSFLNCTLLRLGLGTCLSVCYSAILTKTNRIYRIFSGCMKGNQKTAYISPKSQLLICSGLISVQTCGVIIWLFLDPPSVQVLYPNRNSAVLTCGVGTLSILLSLGYNMVLIFLCTWYAFKTRKIPENFNEAKYIGFSMYSTCIIWLAFIPIFFGTQDDYEIQISSLCMCVILSATVNLFCLFMPKMYIVLLHPEKYARGSPSDRRATTKATSSAILKGAADSGKLGSKGGQESSVSNISDNTAKTPVITPMTPKSPPKSNSNYSFLRPNGDNSTSPAKKASFAEPAANIAEAPPAAAASPLAPAISAGPLQAGATTLMKKSHSHVTFHDEEPSSSFERNTSSPCSKDNSSSPPPMQPPPIGIVAATASNKNSILRTSSNELLDYGRDKLDYVPKKVPQPMSVQVVAADVEMNNHVGCGGGISVGVASSETSASASGSGGWCGDSAEDTASPSLDRRCCEENNDGGRVTPEDGDDEDDDDDDGEEDESWSL